MADGRVARLDEIAGGGGAEPSGAPVARFGELPAAAEPDASAAELTAEWHAPVADLAAAAEAVGPGDGRPEPVGLFDDESVGASRQDVAVVDLASGAPTRRRGRAAPTSRRARDDAAAEDGRAGGAAAGGRAGPRTAGGRNRRTERTGRGAAGAGADPAARQPGRAGDLDPAGGHDRAGRQDRTDRDEQHRGDGHDHERGPRRGRRGRGAAELDPDADPVAAAREICLRLLTDRARTRQELAQALRRRGVPDEAAHAVLERFDEVGLIDDAAFAGQWVRSRHAHRGLARRAIAMELRRKGVSDEDAGEALAEVDADAEEQRARELVDRKLRTLAVGTPEQRAVAGRRLVGMLARKGYGAGTAYRVVKEALAERGAETDELGDAEDPDD
jgi:regulatory protein